MDNLFNTLGFNKSNGLYITKENGWTNLFPKRVEEFFESPNAPDAFYCLDKKPFILFYDKPDEIKKSHIHKAVWNFNDSPVVFIINDKNIEIFNGYKFLRDQDALEKISETNINNLDNIPFTYINIINSQWWDKHKNTFNTANRVDYHLLENIRNTREIMVKRGLDSSLANRLIGKIIFIRYLIDRQVRINFNEYEYLDNEDFASVLTNSKKSIQLLDYIQDKFNGNLFNISAEEYNFDITIFSILRELILGSTIKPQYIQPTLFDIYDFSIIPVEFISNVYELFIGQANQAKSGSYYTPVFLVDYILKETVEKYFVDNSSEYNCKILDPACGSGVFLVEAYRKIVKQYEKLNPDCESNKEKYKEIIKRLAINNLFGIDKDQDAVSVATFSIFLTMLHYQKPADIETFTFPILDNTNFIAADFFDTNNPAVNQLKGFNFIIGNPPWKRGKGKDNLCFEYVKQRKKAEINKKIEIGNNEIAQAFLLRASDFSEEETRCALIVTSKVLYNLKSEKFRRYFLDNFFIDKVFEMAAVRREIFNRSNDSAIAPPAVLFFRYAQGRKTDNNLVEHIALKPSRIFSMFKVFVITKNDFKQVLQQKLKEHDYLWKVLVYGSYLDFNFIQRLKEEYKNVSKILNESSTIIGEGVIIGKNGKYDGSSYVGYKYIDASKKILENFYLDINSCEQFTKKNLHRKRNEDIFTPPVLLISRGINNQFLSRIAILYEKCIYTHAFVGVKSDNINLLKSLNALFLSNFQSYFTLHTGSSAGIEREQTHDQEKWQIPYIENPKLPEFVTKIEKLKKQSHQEKEQPLNPVVHDLEGEIVKILEEMDKSVLESFNLSEEEYALIDYAVNITIPLIMRHKGYEKKVIEPLHNLAQTIRDYIEIFFNRFNPALRNMNLCFDVEVWQNNDFIGLFFKESPLDLNTERIVLKDDKTTGDFLNKTASLGINKITDRLFIQKDIRGFEKNGFYIIKPNEKRLWHKAVAYLDMYEFADAILRTGKEMANV